MSEPGKNTPLSPGPEAGRQHRGGHDQGEPDNALPDAQAPSGPGRQGTVEDQLAAVRADIAALRATLEVTASSDPEDPGSPSVSRGTQRGERFVQQLSNELSDARDELVKVREQLTTVQSKLRASEAQRRRMLQSRTWRWGKVASRLGMAPASALRRVYSRLLEILPPRAGTALRVGVARSRRRPAVTAASSATSARGGIRSARLPTAVVPIPAFGSYSGSGHTDKPGVLLVAYGVDADTLAGMVRELAALAEEVHGIRVIFVTDSDAFHVFRTQSLLFEYIPPRLEWERHGIERPYDDFRAARMQELFQVYGPDRIVHINTVDDLRGLPSTLFAPAA